REHQREKKGPLGAEARRRSGQHARLEQGTLANAERGEPADRDGDAPGQRQRHEREHRQTGSAGLLLQQASGRARGYGVAEPTGDQDDEPGAGPLNGCPQPSHPTVSVKGAVNTRPSTLHWRKSRQVPPTGSSTPTRRCPGLVTVPVTRVGPSTLVQPLTPAAQTCVWK